MDLKEGDLLKNKNGEGLMVTSLSSRHEKTEVYNLNVEGYHNYAVHRRGILAKEGYFSALIVAARDGETDTVQELPQEGADVNARNKWGSTPLMLAKESGHNHIVDLPREAQDEAKWQGMTGIKDIKIRSSQIYRNLRMNPLQFDEATSKTIELIDVLWLQGNAILAAFEVESTTSIYSGLLRMSDLVAMQPNLNIPLYYRFDRSCFCGGIDMLTTAFR